MSLEICLRLSGPKCLWKITNYASYILCTREELTAWPRMGLDHFSVCLFFFSFTVKVQTIPMQIVRYSTTRHTPKVTQPTPVGSTRNITDPVIHKEDLVLQTVLLMDPFSMLRIFPDDDISSTCTYTAGSSMQRHPVLTALLENSSKTSTAAIFRIRHGN